MNFVLYFFYLCRQFAYSLFVRFLNFPIILCLNVATLCYIICIAILVSGGCLFALFVLFCNLVDDSLDFILKSQNCVDEFFFCI